MAGVLGIGTGVALIIVFEIARIFYENRNVPKSHFDEYFVGGKSTHRVFVRLYVFLGACTIPALTIRLLCGGRHDHDLPDGDGQVHDGASASALPRDVPTEHLVRGRGQSLE